MDTFSVLLRELKAITSLADLDGWNKTAALRALFIGQEGIETLLIAYKAKQLELEKNGI